jgi:4-hydroxymandelate oxidase
VSEPGEGGFPTLSDLEALASRRVLDHIWAYIEGGAGDERTMRENLRAFERWVLLPRVLEDVSAVDLRTTLLGAQCATPFFIAPMAYLGEIHPDGESGVARAASGAGTLAAFSTLSTHSIEQIAAAAPDGPRWFQLYLQPEFRVSASLVERAERSRFSAIVVTLDAPVLGVRDRQTKGGFAIDSSRPVGSGEDVLPPSRVPVLQGGTYRLRSDAASNWNVVRDLASVTRLPIVLKGVLTVEDARRGVAAGAKGILVSNHGGRQLDGAIATLEALPPIAAALGSEIEVYLDGGIRRADDVLIALALGAKAVGIGRPILWALAVGGATGVGHYLSLLSTELATAMALAGRRSVSEIDRALVERRSVH